jgi:hypothetical protein
VQVLNVEEQRKVTQGALPLSQGASLSWLAVSDGGAPVTKDSKGMLRMWTAAFGGSWVPVLNEEACDDDIVWPVGVENGELHFVPCNAGACPEVQDLKHIPFVHMYL